MRAPITTVDPRARAAMLGAALTFALLALAYAGARAHHAWNLHRSEQAWFDWRASEARRLASRYGDVRLPQRGEMCTLYAFDNVSGGYVDERRVLCDPPVPPRRSTGDDGFARMLGVANAFRR